MRKEPKAKADEAFLDKPTLSPPRRILIAEPNHSGHRLYYVRLIVDEVVARGDVAIVGVGSGATSSEEWQLHLQKMASRLEVVQCESVTRRVVAELAASTFADHVIVPDGDAIISEIGRSRKWAPHATLTALLMREHGQPSRVPGMALLKTNAKRLLVASANSVRGVHVRVLKSSLWAGKVSPRTLRDPVSLAASGDELRKAAAQWALDSGRYWFGIVGAITQRKNISAVANALIARGGGPLGLVIAGKFSPEVASQIAVLIDELQEHGVAVRIHDRLLSDLELDSMVAAVDCVVLAHSNEGSSGIMGKAAVLGTRVAAAGARSLQVDCAALPHLAAWAPLSEPELSSLLAHCAGLQRPAAVPNLLSREFASALL